MRLCVAVLLLFLCAEASLGQVSQQALGGAGGATTQRRIRYPMAMGQRLGSDSISQLASLLLKNAQVFVLLSSFSFFRCCCSPFTRAEH